MKKILLLTILFTSNTFAIDKFFLECSNTKANEEDIQKVYFFNKIKRFTGYYSTYKDDFVVNFDRVPINISANQNKCKFKSDKSNALEFV